MTWDLFIEALIALAAISSVLLAGYTIYQVIQDTEAPASGTVCNDAAEEDARSLGRQGETIRPFSQPAAKGFGRRRAS